MSRTRQMFEGAERNEALGFDNEDELQSFRDRFYVSKDVIYMDGNSLGLLSKDAEEAVIQALRDWRDLGVDGWTKAAHPWFTLPESLGAQTAPLIGAKSHEVVVAGSTTTNLHTLLATFYRPELKSTQSTTGQSLRTKILADTDNFPSDLYALHSHIRLHGRPDTDLVLIPPSEDGLFDEARLIEAMTPDVCLVLLPTVWYKFGQLLDIPRIAQAAHDRGILLGVDACHSAGVVPHHFHNDGVDFAVWCNYKYLNSGPGSTAGIFVHERHHQRSPGLAGWFGSQKDKQFDMSFPLNPAGTAGQWQISTPPILSTVAVGASLKLVAEAGIERIRRKSLQQTAYLRHLLETRVIGAGLGGCIATPREDSRRGGHIAFEHPHAVALCKALKTNGVIPDFRPPDVVRLAPIPLYTSYQDVWDAVERLREILTNESYLQFGESRDIVT